MKSKISTLALAAALAASTSAHAQDPNGNFTTRGSTYTRNIPPCQEQFRNLPKLAARLHVKPNPNGDGMKIRMCDGRVYAMFDLINALLDRMDKASK